MQAKKADNDYDYDSDYIDDDKRYNNYLCMYRLSQFEKIPELKNQVEFYKQIIKKMVRAREYTILDKLDLDILSSCWERLNRQNGIKDKESYYVEMLKNEVNKNGHRDYKESS